MLNIQELPCNSLVSGHAYFNFDCDCVVEGEEMPLANMRICAQSSNYSDCFYTDNNGAFWLLPIFEGDYTLTAYPNNDFIQGSLVLKRLLFLIVQQILTTLIFSFVVIPLPI